MVILSKKKAAFCSVKCRAWCCRYLVFFLDANAEHDPLFFALRGIKIDPEDNRKLLVPSRCHWLNEHNKCRIYAHRPKSCQVYQCDKLKELERSLKYETQTKDDRKTT